MKKNTHRGYIQFIGHHPRTSPGPRSNRSPLSPARRRPRSLNRKPPKAVPASRLIRYSPDVFFNAHIGHVDLILRDIASERVGSEHPRSDRSPFRRRHGPGGGSLDLTSIGVGSGGGVGTGDDGRTCARCAPSRTRSSWERFYGRVADSRWVSTVPDAIVMGRDMLVGE